MTGTDHGEACDCPECASDYAYTRRSVRTQFSKLGEAIFWILFTVALIAVVYAFRGKKP